MVLFSWKVFCVTNVFSLPEHKCSLQVLLVIINEQPPRGGSTAREPLRSSVRPHIWFTLSKERVLHRHVTSILRKRFHLNKTKWGHTHTQHALLHNRSREDGLVPQRWWSKLQPRGAARVLCCSSEEVLELVAPLNSSSLKTQRATRFVWTWTRALLSD